MSNFEHRAVIKYFVKKGMGPKEIFEDMSATLRDSAPSYATVKKWAALFKGGRENLEDDDRSGRPSTSVTEDTISKVENLVMADRRLTVRYLAAKVGISATSVETILHQHLRLNKVSARWVPRMLSPSQKMERVRVSTTLLERLNEDPHFMDRLVTQDETWVPHFDPETKAESMQWKHTDSPPPRKFKVAKSVGKIMTTIFWDSEGLLLVDFLQHGMTITGQYYADLLVKLREAIKEKRRGKITKGVLLLQDNAPVHKSRVAMEKAKSLGFELLPHPPYSPDLAPSDFYLFPNMKKHLRGRVFSSDDEVISAVKVVLEGFDNNFFLTGLQMLEKRWNKCVAVEGDYIEK